MSGSSYASGPCPGPLIAETCLTRSRQNRNRAGAPREQTLRLAAHRTTLRRQGPSPAHYRAPPSWRRGALARSAVRVARAFARPKAAAVALKHTLAPPRRHVPVAIPVVRVKPRFGPRRGLGCLADGGGGAARRAREHRAPPPATERLALDRSVVRRQLTASRTWPSRRLSRVLAHRPFHDRNEVVGSRARSRSSAAMPAPARSEICPRRPKRTPRPLKKRASRSSRSSSLS